MVDIVFIQLFSYPLCPIHGVVVILEETTALRIEMFHHRIKVITQNHFVMICSDSSL